MRVTLGSDEAMVVARASIPWHSAFGGKADEILVGGFGHLRKGWWQSLWGPLTVQLAVGSSTEGAWPGGLTGFGHCLDQQPSLSHLKQAPGGCRLLDFYVELQPHVPLKAKVSI